MNEKLQKIVNNRTFIETPCGYTFLSRYDVDEDYYFYDVYDGDGNYLGEVSAADVNDNIIDSCDEAEEILYDMDGLEILAEDLM